VLFPGDSEIDQLYRIFRQCGTPNSKTWHHVDKLREYRDTFPQWSAQPWGKLDECLAKKSDRINAMLVLDPKQRASAETLKGKFEALIAL
jgi:hypothetical protein